MPVGWQDLHTTQPDIVADSKQACRTDAHMNARVRRSRSYGMCVAAAYTHTVLANQEVGAANDDSMHTAPKGQQHTVKTRHNTIPATPTRVRLGFGNLLMLRLHSALLSLWV